MPNIPALPLEGWLVVIIFSAVVAYGIKLWLRRRRMTLQEVEFSLGPVKGTYKQDNSATPTEQADSSGASKHSVNVSGMKMFGKNRVEVRRDDANVSDSTLAGENEIVIDEETQKRRSPKSK